MKSQRFSALGIGRAASFAMIACLALTVPFSAANAGFFDFLFAPFHPAQPAYTEQYAPRPYPKKRREAVHHPHNLVARLHPSQGGRGAHAAPVVGLMDDGSLRNGDVVMTADGIRIFTGDPGSHHSEDDFAKIADVEGLSKTERSALLFINSGAAGAEAAVVSGRSVADSAPAAGQMITDPRGNKICYVGP